MALAKLTNSKMQNANISKTAKTKKDEDDDDLLSDSSMDSNNNSSQSSGGKTKAKTAYKHIPHCLKPPEVVEKRNARERKRVKAVNEAFYKLRACVPIENRNKRVSKVKTLQRAIDYIRKLEIILESDQADLVDSPSGLEQLANQGRRAKSTRAKRAPKQARKVGTKPSDPVQSLASKQQLSNQVVGTSSYAIPYAPNMQTTTASQHCKASPTVASQDAIVFKECNAATYSSQQTNLQDHEQQQQHHHHYQQQQQQQVSYANYEPIQPLLPETPAHLRSSGVFEQAAPVQYATTRRFDSYQSSNTNNTSDMQAACYSTSGSFCLQDPSAYYANNASSSYTAHDQHAQTRQNSLWGQPSPCDCNSPTTDQRPNATNVQESPFKISSSTSSSNNLANNKQRQQQQTSSLAVGSVGESPLSSSLSNYSSGSPLVDSTSDYPTTATSTSATSVARRSLAASLAANGAEPSSEATNAATSLASNNKTTNQSSGIVCQSSNEHVSRQQLDNSSTTTMELSAGNLASSCQPLVEQYSSMHQPSHLNQHQQHPNSTSTNEEPLAFSVHYPAAPHHATYDHYHHQHHQQHHHLQQDGENHYYHHYLSGPLEISSSAQQQQFSTESPQFQQQPIYFDASSSASSALQQQQLATTTTATTISAVSNQRLVFGLATPTPSSRPSPAQQERDSSGNGATTTTTTASSSGYYDGQTMQTCSMDSSADYCLAGGRRAPAV